MRFQGIVVAVVFGIWLTVFFSRLDVAVAQPVTSHDCFVGRSPPTESVLLPQTLVCVACGCLTTCCSSRHKKKPASLSLEDALPSNEHSVDESAAPLSSEDNNVSAEESVSTISGDGGDEVSVTISPQLPKYPYVVLWNLMQYAEGRYPKAYQTLRKNGHGVFMGQLPTDETYSRVPTALLRLLCPFVTFGVDVDVEYQTSKQEPGRGTGCANIWTRDQAVYDLLLSVSKQMFVDMSYDGNGLQLVMTPEFFSRFPQLSYCPHATVWSVEPTLSEYAERRGRALQQHNGWSPLGKGSVNVEPSARRPQKSSTLLVTPVTIPVIPPPVALVDVRCHDPYVAQVVGMRHNPYETY